MLEYDIVPLPDSWVVRSSDGEIIRSGPNLWRYAYALIPSDNGIPRVTAPREEDLLRLQGLVQPRNTITIASTTQ